MKNPVVFDDYHGVKVYVNEWGLFDAKIDGVDIVSDTYMKLKEKIDQTLKNKQKAKKKTDGDQCRQRRSEGGDGNWRSRAARQDHDDAKARTSSIRRKFRRVA